MTDGPMTKFVSPEYRARCIEWALQAGIKSPDKIIAAAEKFYKYVHGEK